MVCQICKEAMPFRKRDGQYYFESVESPNMLAHEHHALFLALCPVCAAKYKEFVKHDPVASERFQGALISEASRLSRLRLAKRTQPLRLWTPTSLIFRQFFAGVEAKMYFAVARASGHTHCRTVARLQHKRV